MSATNPADKPGFRFTGWHFLAVIVAFFAVVIAVDTWFAVLAVRTHPGEVSVTPYEDGLIYNQEIAQMQAQARLGWRAAAAAEADKVVVEVEDSSGQPVRGLVFTAKMERPATESGRLTPRFREAAPGRYVAEVGGLAGAWDLSAEARDPAGHVFQLTRRLTWR